MKFRYALAIVLAASNTACWTKRKPAIVAAPPIPAPAPIRPPIRKEPPKAPVIEEMPPEATTELALQEMPAVEIPAVTPPSAPRPAPPKRPPVAQTPGPTIPRLGPMMSEEQRTQLEASYDKEQRYARSVLEAIRGRRLNSNQSENANRVRAFLRQAEDLRERDLSTAAQLAHRAALMAQDLERTVR